MSITVAWQRVRVKVATVQATVSRSSLDCDGTCIATTGRHLGDSDMHVLFVSAELLDQQALCEVVRWESAAKPAAI